MSPLNTPTATPTGPLTAPVPALNSLKLQDKLEQNGFNWRSWLPLFQSTMDYYCLWNNTLKKPQESPYVKTCLNFSIAPGLVETTASMSAIESWNLLYSRFGSSKINDASKLTGQLVKFEWDLKDFQSNLDKLEAIKTSLIATFTNSNGNLASAADIITSIVHLTALQTMPPLLNVFQQKFPSSLTSIADVATFQKKASIAFESLP